MTLSGSGGERDKGQSPAPEARLGDPLWPLTRCFSLRALPVAKLHAEFVAVLR